MHFPDAFPTPPASSVAPSMHPSPLPKPRRHPLRPGGPKETGLIAYLDHGINNVQKRVHNRINKTKGSPRSEGEEEGYRTFREAAKDLDGILDVIWVSGSRKSLSVCWEIRTSKLMFMVSKPPDPLPSHRRRFDHRYPAPVLPVAACNLSSP